MSSRGGRGSGEVFFSPSFCLTSSAHVREARVRRLEAKEADDLGHVALAVNQLGAWRGAERRGERKRGEG